MFSEMQGPQGLRPQYAAVADWLQSHGLENLALRRPEAEALFRKVGITFAVYGDGADEERLIPFDMIPRIFSHPEWDFLERGCSQRVRALNAFLSDVYGAQEILAAGLIPAHLVRDNPAYLPAMAGFRPPKDVWVHIAGVDLVRTGPEDFFVLEDNCRTPSGVSYMIESREVMLGMFPELMGSQDILGVESYPDLLAETLAAVAPPRCEQDPTLAILTPGRFNSAYYEHSFLCDRMGVELVEGQDLFCDAGRLWMRTVRGPEPIDVLYRRVDDAFLDPLVFRPDSLLGVPGLMQVYREGGVTLVNAPCTGIADDKAIYSFVPDMIRFYLGEEPILANVETYRCETPDALAYVLERLDQLVVKQVDGSGGYGMLVGPKATQAERDAFAAKLRANPKGYIAQPTLALSTVPTLTDSGLGERHVDLRPFVLSGPEPRLVPGGLTRVALNAGSLVVNSSQGGGVKDTWVLGPDAC